MNVAILGATGAVGREMMKILAERSFPVEELRLLASPRSAGQKLLWQGRELTVQTAEDSAFEGMDIVLGAAENDIAKRFAPAIVKAGAVFVDNSSAFRMDPNVPLVIPEINPEDARRHKGIIANPNCTTIVSLVAINALNQDSPIQSIIASSYQAVSGAGAGGPRELMEEVALLRHMCERGYTQRLLLSLDTTAQRMAAYGGEISLCYLLERFLPRLEAAGFPPGTLADFTVLNCRRLFAG